MHSRMHSLAIVLSVVGVAPLAVVVEPTTTGPATTRPTTLPAAEVGLDLISPKATLISLIRAFAANDSDAAAACCGDESMQQFARAMTPVFAPTFELDALLREKFGMGLGSPPTEWMLIRPGEVEAAQVEREDGRAVVTIGVNTFELRPGDDGKWRIHTMNDKRLTDEQIEAAGRELLRLYKPVNEAIEEVTRDVRSGRLTTRVAAEGALRAKEEAAKGRKR